jgi:hypothetical protein
MAPSRAATRNASPRSAPSPQSLSPSAMIAVRLQIGTQQQGFGQLHRGRG